MKNKYYKRYYASLFIGLIITIIWMLASLYRLIKYNEADLTPFIYAVILLLIDENGSPKKDIPFEETPPHVMD